MRGYYTSGEFARKANVSIRTVRYYDQQGILKPTCVTEAGYRLYTDGDFLRLQKILSLKYLGFSLDEIRSMTVNDEDEGSIGQSLRLQLQLVRKKIDHLKLVEQTLEETSEMLRRGDELDWNKILHLIHITNMEKSLVEQYKNGANLDIRIQLHDRYTTNPEGWFRWIYRQLELKPGQRVLELGCGNGQLWKDNLDRLPPGVQIVLSDASPGMVEDARESLRTREDPRFSWKVFDCARIPFPDRSFDLVIANHLLFYVKDIGAALEEASRVLKPGGLFCCSTYGREHMKEISQMGREFDARMKLSDVNLYEIFGLENGEEELRPYFSDIQKLIYEDSLNVDQTGPLLEYILSCHGNQNDVLNGRYEDFRRFLDRKMEKQGTIRITKQAGIFLCGKRNTIRKQSSI